MISKGSVRITYRRLGRMGNNISDLILENWFALRKPITTPHIKKVTVVYLSLFPIY